MKKNKMLFLGLITVFVAVLSLSLVSGTYAKYTSTVEGTDQATVAKWAWEVKDANNLSASTFEFNLFNTIKDTDPENASAETDVKEGLIAPGTKGSFDLKITNNSEVSGEVTIAIEISHNGVTQYMPLTLTVTGTDPDETVNYTVDDTNKKATAEGKVTFTLSPSSLNPSSVTKTVTVNWEWPFSSVGNVDDANDTALATEDTLPIFTAKVKLTFVQVD